MIMVASEKPDLWAGTLFEESLSELSVYLLLLKLQATGLFLTLASQQRRGGGGGAPPPPPPNGVIFLFFFRIFT